MANNYGRIGPTTALQLLQLWYEGKHSANVAEIEAWESIVLDFITALEARMLMKFGPRDDEPEDGTLPF